MELCIEDDGVGFDGQAQFDLVHLLANKNFGLAGMHERAALIGAQVNIKTGARPRNAGASDLVRQLRLDP